MPLNPPDDMPRVSPVLFYRDVSAAIEFLAKSFGLAERLRMSGPDGRVAHAEMTFASGLVMMEPAIEARGTRSPGDLPGVNQGLYLYVDDVDAHCRRAKASGAEITSEPQDMFWGDRIYAARDLEGHHWTFAQRVKDVSPEDLRPPGA